LGNPLTDAVGEAAATFVYLLVLLSSENIVWFAWRGGGVSSEGVMYHVMLVILAMVLWMLLLPVRVQVRLDSSGSFPWIFYAIAIAAMVLSYFVLKNHRRFYDWDIEEKMRRDEERRRSKVEGRPTEVAIGGEKIEL
jgi:hypothetical protein